MLDVQDRWFKDTTDTCLQRPEPKNKRLVFETNVSCQCFETPSSSLFSRKYSFVGFQHSPQKVRQAERERERTPTRSLSFLFGENCKDSWERDLCKIASLGGLHLLISIFTGFSREECITMSLQSHPKSSHSSHTSPVTEMPKAEKRCQPRRVRPVWASRRCSLSHLDGQMDPPARAPQARSRYHFSRSDRCFGPFVA